MAGAILSLPPSFTVMGRQAAPLIMKDIPVTFTLTHVLARVTAQPDKGWDLAPDESPRRAGALGRHGASGRDGGRGRSWSKASRPRRLA